MEFLIFYLGIGLIFVIYSIQPIDYDFIESKSKENYKQLTNDDWPLSENTTKAIAAISTVIGYFLILLFWPIYLLRFIIEKIKG